MIVTYMIISLLSMVQIIFSIFPDLPDTPQAIVDGGTWITDQIALVVSVLNYVFTPALMAATVVVIIGMFTFEHIYHGAMWIVRKIPVLNIK